MNEDLPEVTPLKRALMTEADLRSMLAGLEPGSYRTVDLHPRYVAWAIREGRKPGSAKSLGESIRRVLNPESVFCHGHVRAWTLSKELVSGGDDDHQPS